MFDALADWMTVPLLHYEARGAPLPRTGMHHALVAPYEDAIQISRQKARPRLPPLFAPSVHTLCSHLSVHRYGLFRTADGGVVLAVQHNGEWARLCDEV